MKNLENFGVQEMTLSEEIQIDGGNLYRWAFALAFAALNTDWDQAFDDMSRGFDDAH